MARKPRLYYPGALYHVMLRGNGGQPIFFSSPDYRQFYHLLQEGYQRFDHRIHAFCLMSNHVHLAIEVGAIPLAPIMQNISFRYTRWINQRQKRMGHLFQGRYKALLVDQENYLLALIRYIHLNPIRAGVAKELVDFPWCSHLAYLGKRRLEWLHTDWGLSHFSPKRGEARKLYEDYIRSGRNIASPVNFQKGSAHSEIIGEDHFVTSVLKKLENIPCSPPLLERIIHQVAQVYQLEEKELRSAGQSRKLSEARAMIGMLAFDWKSATIRKVGKVCNRDDSTISFGVHRLRQRLKESEGLQNQLEELKRQILA